MEIDWLLIVLYLFFLIVFIVDIIKDFKNNKTINMIIFCKIFYILFFFLTPITFIISSGLSNDNINVWESMIFHSSFSEKLLILFVSLIGYLFMNIGFIFSKKRFINSAHKKNSDFKVSNVEIANNKKKKIILIILLIIGWICLLLWTKVYGGLFEIFNYASKIRSGVVEIYNPFTFLKYFCQLLLIVFLCNLDDFINKKKIGDLLLCIVSGFGSFVYLIANDGRNLILSVVIAIFLNLFYKKKIKIKTIALLVFMTFLGLFLITNLDNITSGIRQNKKIELLYEINPVDIINNEYGYIYMDLSNTIYLNNNGQLDYNFFDELKCIAFFLIPQRYKPADLTNLYDYNNHFYPSFFGTIPPDIISASIYLLDFIGILIIPFIVGFLIGKVDIYFKNRVDYNSIYKQIYFLLLTMLPLRACGYFDFAAILFNFVFVYVALIMCKIVYKVKLK